MLDTAKLKSILGDSLFTDDFFRCPELQSPVFEIDETTRRLMGGFARPQETNTEIAKLKAVLGYCDPSCGRDEWRNLVWGILSTGWSCAEQIAREWSQGSQEKYDGYSFASVVASFDPVRSKSIGLGTVYHIAQRNGCQPGSLVLNLPKTNDDHQNIQEISSAIEDQFSNERIGDIGNAEKFCELFKGKLLYVSVVDKWLQWHDGAGYLWCESGENTQAAIRVAKNLMHEAMAMFTFDQNKAKNLMQHATKSHGQARIEAMTTLAKTYPGMTCSMLDLDSDPWLLGVQNGVVDLKTGQLIQNRQELRITRYCDAAYDEDANCGEWVKFLNAIFENDQETIETIQIALGYTLCGSTTEEKLFICYGYGANGKSVFSNVVYSILGDYARTAPPSLLVARNNGDSSARPELAGLAGCRYVSINEMQSGDRLDEQVVKMLAGREMISARFLYRDFFEYLPAFTPWLRTNHKPIIRGDDHGLWRRLVVIPFNRKFTGDECDPYLEDKLLAERDAILAWMVQGCLKWQKQGLELSAKIQAECNAYRCENDLLGQFLEEKCSLCPGKKTNQQSLYLSWRTWCLDNGTQPGSQVGFTRRLSERGVTVKKSNGKGIYIGVAPN